MSSFLMQLAHFSAVSKMLQNNQWQPPSKSLVLEGQYCRLEPLQSHHSDGLLEVITVPDADERYKYLLTMPTTKEKDVHQQWINGLVNSKDPFIYVVFDKRTGEIVGRHSLMRIDTTHGVMEIGGVVWGPKMARTRIATEAFYLTTKYAFDLGYRRYEWKCDNDNVASRNAALRFGFQFEGIFRQHMVVRGRSRDTAWFSILDKKWASLKNRFESWLSECNFTEDGLQIKDLGSF